MASSRIMAAGPAATGTRRLAGPRREAQDELGCGRGRPALGRTSGLDMCCAARGPSSPRLYCSKATILGSLEPKELAVDRLGLTNNPRIKHCRASHLAACGHTVLPKIGPVIALRRRTDYQSSPNWLSGAEDSHLVVGRNCERGLGRVERALGGIGRGVDDGGAN